MKALIITTIILYSWKSLMDWFEKYQEMERERNRIMRETIIQYYHDEIDRIYAHQE